MKEEDILANAPKGNFKSVKTLGDRHAAWVPENYRSLADIQTIVELRKQIVELEQALGLSRIALDHQKTLLASCETALSERDVKIAELEKELEQKTLQFVGYTNGNQITYAKDGEGAFYPKTLNNCYIPLYMLNVHLHRLSGTMSEAWMNYLQAKQLREGKK